MFLGREVNRSRDYSELTAQQIDAEAHKLLKEAFDTALSLLTQHRDVFERITAVLLEKETLDGRDVEDIVKHGRILTAEERAGKAAAGSKEAETGVPVAGKEDGKDKQ